MIKILTKPKEGIEQRAESLPVFFEPTGIRWRFSKILFVVLAIIGGLLSFALTKYYFNSISSTNILNSYANEFNANNKKDLKELNSFGILSPDYTSKYVFGSVKENSKYLKNLIINPFEKDNITTDGAFFEAIDFKNRILKSPITVLVNKNTQSYDLEKLLTSDQFVKLKNNSKVSVDTLLFEVSNQQQIDTYSKLAEKTNLRVSYKVDSNNNTTLNFNQSLVYYTFSHNIDQPLKEQVDSFISGYNRIKGGGSEINIILPSGYSYSKDGKSITIDPFEVQQKLNVGDKINFKNDTPILKYENNDVKMYGKWFYFNLFTTIGDRIPTSTLFGLNSLENSESGSYKFIKERKLINEFTLSDKIITSGNGLIQNIKNYGSSGEITADTKNNLLTLIKIEKKPVPAELIFTGYSEKTTALTFDDGPSVINTPKVLAILDNYKVQATFFVTGQQILKHPDNLREIAKKGHQIENHTFSHPNLSVVSDNQIRYEISETNKLIKDISGYQPRYFRVPFDAFGVPETSTDLRINKIAEEYNLKLYQIDSDTKDFATDESLKDSEQKQEKLKIDEIKTQVLFHDGPDVDRELTLTKLEDLLDKLSSAKYSLITVNQYSNKDEASIPIVKDPTILDKLTNLNASTADIVSLFYDGLINIILFFGTFTVIAFIIFLFRNRFLQPKEDYIANVTALIPCYNEEKMVVSTVQSLLDNDLPGLKILVIDDGSKDKSFLILKKTFTSNPRVKIISKPNGGKSTALNYGLKFVDTEFFVTMDSDTIFAKDSVRLMLRHFKDQKVSAVAGNVQIGNEFFAQKHSDKSMNFFRDYNWLTSCQRFEYITGQNFEKLAFNGMGCVIVVPGAIGCFRTKDVISLGGYNEDTLAEDTNLTIELLKTGKRVRYEPNALCYTEAPDTITQFLKQRFRWSFGTFQVAWKNKKILFNPKYGSLSLFALPYMVFGLFNLIMLPLTSIGIFIIAIRTTLGFIGVYNFSESDIKSLSNLFFLFIMFTIISLLRILYSIWKDRSVNKYQVLLAYPIIITVYNALIAYITIKAFFACIKGQRQGWGHLVRKGTVKMNSINQSSTL